MSDSIIQILEYNIKSEALQVITAYQKENKSFKLVNSNHNINYTEKISSRFTMEVEVEQLVDSDPLEKQPTIEIKGEKDKEDNCISFKVSIISNDSNTTCFSIINGSILEAMQSKNLESPTDILDISRGQNNIILGSSFVFSILVGSSRSSTEEIADALMPGYKHQLNSEKYPSELPIGYGSKLYSIPAKNLYCFHLSKLNSESYCSEVSIKPDINRVEEFSSSIGIGQKTRANLLNSAIKSQTTKLQEEYQESNFIVMVSGIDSFIPALTFKKGTLFLHVVATKHILGIFQAYLVKSFFTLTGKKNNLIILQQQWGTFEHPISVDLHKHFLARNIGMREFIHRYYIDLVAKEYIKAQNIKNPFIITGDILGLFSCFNGTLQRDMPVFFGRVRGSLRRILKSQHMARLLTIINIPFLGVKESLCRAIAAVMTNSVNSSRFTSYFPSFQYIRIGFHDDERYLYYYYKDMIDCFVDKNGLLFTLFNPGIIMGFIHQQTYLFPAMLAGAEVSSIYKQKHSYVVTNRLFSHYFSQTYGITSLLFKPKQLQYTALSKLLVNTSWEEIFHDALKNCDEKIITKLKSNYWNLLKLALKGPLGY